MHTAVGPVPFVTRVRARDFRSIARCDVTLGPLTVLLGFNASGKSNFLDAPGFVADALETSPAGAIASRGGLDALLHRSAGRNAESFRIALDLAVPSADVGAPPVSATYGLTIDWAREDYPEDRPRLVREEILIAGPDGRVDHSPSPRPRRPRQRLILPLLASDDEQLAIVESALRGIRFYDLDSETLRALDEDATRPSELGRSGQHLGPVIGAIRDTDAPGKERLDSYLAALVPNALGIDERREGRYSTVEARFRVGEADPTVETFPREVLSEGTLRAAGVLAALFQSPAFDGRIPLVGIEEPETALHPATVGALYEALDDAAARTQVIVTSQSSDLLDSEYIRLEHIRAVANVDGQSYIGEVDPAGRRIVTKGLMTISELHRSGQLLPSSVPPGASDLR
jgi:predicted ATPase